MTGFVTLVLDDGTEVSFQAAESDLVQQRGGPQEVEQESLTRLTALADAAQGVAQSFRDRVKPDELTIEIGVGLSGEVGWFFAKSGLDASIKLTLTWKGDPPAASNPALS